MNQATTARTVENRNNPGCLHETTCRNEGLLTAHDLVDPRAVGVRDPGRVGTQEMRQSA